MLFPADAFKAHPKTTGDVYKANQIVDKVGHNYQHGVFQNIVRLLNQHKYPDQVGKTDDNRLDGDEFVVLARFVEPFNHKDVRDYLEAEHKVDTACRRICLEKDYRCVQPCYRKVGDQSHRKQARVQPSDLLAVITDGGYLTHCIGIDAKTAKYQRKVYPGRSIVETSVQLSIKQPLDIGTDQHRYDQPEYLQDKIIDGIECYRFGHQLPVPFPDAGWYSVSNEI